MYILHGAKYFHGICKVRQRNLKELCILDLEVNEITCSDDTQI